MLSEIKSNLEAPHELEKLYRSNKTQFTREFSMLYAESNSMPIMQFWHARLNFEKPEESLFANKSELYFICGAILLAGTIAKFPQIFSIDPEFFFSRNLSFIIFPILACYFAYRNSLSATKIGVLATLTFAACLFINLLPINTKSDTLILSCMHMMLFMWSVVGLAYVGGFKNIGGRLNYLKFNGDLVVISALLTIAGGILTAITLGLFSLIGADITRFYFNYVIYFGLAAIPLLGAYLTQTNTQLVDKVSPVIAKIFSPIVLVMLVCYLIAIVYSGKDPYTDREFLMMFNILLIGVMALIFFAIAGNQGDRSKSSALVLLCLSVVTVLVNCVALSAIVFRISEWGFTPNRTAILGANLLMLVNLILVCIQLIKVNFNDADEASVSTTIAHYLPVYFIWTIFITFVLPFLFGFK